MLGDMNLNQINELKEEQTKTKSKKAKIQLKGRHWKA